MNKRQKFFAKQYAVVASEPTVNDEYKKSPVNQEEFRVMFPINEETNHPEDILGQLQHETNPTRQQSLMMLLQRVSNETIDNRDLSDDEIISMIKARSADSPTENARYMEMLNAIVQEGVVKNSEPTPQPAQPAQQEPQSVTDPAISVV